MKEILYKTWNFNLMKNNGLGCSIEICEDIPYGSKENLVLRYASRDGGGCKAVYDIKVSEAKSIIDDWVKKGYERERIIISCSLIFLVNFTVPIQKILYSR